MPYLRQSIAILASVLMSNAIASSAYLCGSDEDGCYLSDPSSCICVIKDENQSNVHYCLNFHDDGAISCDATNIKQPCPTGQESFADEGTCAAVALQSESTPACPEKKQAFCDQHRIVTVPASQLQPPDK